MDMMVAKDRERVPMHAPFTMEGTSLHVYTCACIVSSVSVRAFAVFMYQHAVMHLLVSTNNPCIPSHSINTAPMIGEVERYLNQLTDVVADTLR